MKKVLIAIWLVLWVITGMVVAAWLAPAIAGNLASQGLDDPDIYPPAHALPIIDADCWAIRWVLPCKDRETGIDDPHDPMMPPSKPTIPTSPKPTKVKGNNGWGNGSQDAPGDSGPNNNAENGPKGKNDGRGRDSGNSGKGK